MPRMRSILLGALLAWCCCTGTSSAWAAHAYAQFGDIKYPPGFAHFDYVNPQAPKGGETRLVPPTAGHATSTSTTRSR